jgi:hypothetical protein
MKWLFFAYSLPTEPSKARVYVWRQLKKLGAVNYQSAWVLPHSTERIGEMKKLMGEIEKYKGESLLIEGKAVDKSQGEMIQKALVESRNEEYGELIEKCEDFFKEIEHEIERKNFIFAEVEENEEELKKLKKWMKKVEKRETVETPLRKIALEKLKTCEKMFDDFAKMVFLHIQGGSESKKPQKAKISKKKMLKTQVSNPESTINTPGERKAAENE